MTEVKHSLCKYVNIMLLRFLSYVILFIKLFHLYKTFSLHIHVCAKSPRSRVTLCDLMASLSMGFPRQE